MATHQDILSLVDSGSQVRRPPVVGMKFLHERAVRADHVIARRSLLKPQDFISFILGHRAAAAAAALKAPRVGVSLSCCTPSGKAAVEISL